MRLGKEYLSIMPRNVSDWPYGFDSVLRRIGEADGSLLDDIRLVELKRHWDAR